MSFSEVIFDVYHGGYWVKDYTGDFAYLDGHEKKSITCKPEEFFTVISTEFSEGLYGQKIWYKLPFEDHKERKSLINGDVSFKNMCEAGHWVGCLDMFFVDSTEHPHDVEVHDPCEEEIRVERNVASFIDEDPNYDYHDTPPNSDDEDGGEQFVRFRRGSGHLELRQVFETIEDFKEALVDYALKEGWNIKLNRHGKVKSEGICSIDGCLWRIYCSYEERIGKWMVKTYEDVHSCIKDGYCKILKSGVIAKMYMDEIRTNPGFKPKTIQNDILSRFNLMTTVDKCKKAKKKVIDIIHREHVEQFSRLKDYKDAILATNLNSTVELNTVFDDDGAELFRRFYVCFDVIRKLWSMWCRPIFGIDGCFLKCTLKGQLLAAVGRDANNGIYPIAWAVVDVENEDNWTWFLEKLQVDFNLQEGQGYAVISDRQKGLLNAVERVLPQVEHRMCARHIYGNLKKVFPNQSEMKNLFWRVADSYTLAEYEANLENVKSYDIRVYDAIMERNPKNCSIAFCSPTSQCVDVHNNISECFNNAIDPARYMPMVEMLEMIRRGAMMRIDMRKTIARNHLGRFTPRAIEFMEKEEKKIKFCRFVPGGEGRYDVREAGVSYSVNIRLRTCVCRRWDMSGIPCRHALRVITEKKLNREDYISNWYLNSRQQSIYSDSIRTVNGMLFWNRSGSLVLPPPSLVEQIENRRGRKPKPKRTKGKNESPSKKKKVTREKRIMHCRRCGHSGHNATKCHNFGAKCIPPSKRNTKNTNEGEEASQASQATQASQEPQD